jgi:hypothetical protein
MYVLSHLPLVVRARPLPVPIKTTSISHRSRSLDIHTTQNLLDRSLNLLSIRRNRNLRRLIHNARNMTSTKFQSDDFLNTLDQISAEVFSLLHLEEQDYCFIVIGFASATNAQCILDLFGEMFKQDVVDFCTSKPHTRGLENAIAATKHIQSSSLGVETDEIAMMPYTRESLKVGALVFGFASRAPELDGLAREGFCADEVAG